MIYSTKDSRLIGWMIFGSFVAGLLSVAPAVDSNEYIYLIAENANQSVWAALFQFLMSCFYAGIMILFYPKIKTKAPKLALAAFGFRFLAIGLNLLGIVLLGTLLIWSQQYLAFNMPSGAIWLGVGETLKQTRDLINHGWMILALGAGNFALFTALLRNKLLPAWLIWIGIVGAGFSCLASVLILFQLLKVISATYILMNLPTAIFELVLATWLIFRGFKFR